MEFSELSYIDFLGTFQRFFLDFVHLLELFYDDNVGVDMEQESVNLGDD